jgi:hypothetical protein
MQLKTILNRVEPFKSFVYGKVRWVEEAERLTLEVKVQARKNGQPICSGCDRPGPGYDRLPERRFEFVPLWGIAVYFVYALRRVDCPTCGVTVERVSTPLAPRAIIPAAATSSWPMGACSSCRRTYRRESARRARRRAFSLL